MKQAKDRDIRAVLVHPRHSKVSRPMNLSRIYLVALLIIALVLAGFIYDRGKKCGAWEAEFERSKPQLALSQKPIACWHLH
jgi:hypothetical protein